MPNKINALMNAQNITFNELSEKLSISKQTLTRKISGTMDWTYSEIMILTELLHIENPESFFFDSY